MSDFIHLTNKTEYSLSEGALPISRIAELCQSFEMPAVGISDSNNMFGALEFSTQISNAGIQPIIGCNVKIKTPSEYMHESIKDLFFEINLYSKNNLGYQNLLKLISMAYMKNKKNSYVELNDLFNLKDGIILLTGGKNSILKQCKNKIITNQANNFIKILKDNFNDDLYVEIQRLGKSYEILDEYSLLSLAYDNSLPLVATNDVLYESPEYYEAHDALSCIEKKLYVSQADRLRLSDQHYFKSQNEMKELFSDLPESLYNTVEIAKKCSFKPDIQKPVLPVFPISNQSEKDQLNKGN